MITAREKIMLKGSVDNMIANMAVELPKIPTEVDRKETRNAIKEMIALAEKVDTFKPI